MSTAPTSAQATQKAYPPPAENSLYLGDLAPETTEGEIKEVFSQLGPVTSVHICVNRRTKKPKGYGYVSYCDPADATKALEEFKNALIAGKPCQVARARRGGSQRLGPIEANIFVKNIPRELSSQAFHDTFAGFGKVLSSKLALNAAGASKGYGFVQYATADEAKNAISKTHGSTLDITRSANAAPLKPLLVTFYLTKAARPPKQKVPSFRNIFLRNLPSDITQESLESSWSTFGTITSAFLKLDADGKPTGTGFINFESHETALAAIQSTQKNTPDQVRATRAFHKHQRRAYQARREQKKSQKSIA